MVDKKMEIKPKLEREYVIPLREKCRSVPRYKKTNKAVKTIKEFLAKHMKIYDRDLNKIKIDKYVNEYLWFRGIRNPPHKVKVKATKEDDIVRVELAEMPDKLKFKKAREEKREDKAKESLEKPKTALEKAKEAMKKPKEEKPEESEKSESKEGKSEEEKEEEKEKQEKEKKAAVVEAGQKRQKQEAKKQKHMIKPKSPKQLHREQKIMSK